MIFDKPDSLYNTNEVENFARNICKKFKFCYESKSIDLFSLRVNCGPFTLNDFRSLKIYNVRASRFEKDYIKTSEGRESIFKMVELEKNRDNKIGCSQLSCEPIIVSSKNIDCIKMLNRKLRRYQPYQKLLKRTTLVTETEPELGALTVAADATEPTEADNIEFQRRKIRVKNEYQLAVPLETSVISSLTSIKSNYKNRNVDFSNIELAIPNLIKYFDYVNFNPLNEVYPEHTQTDDIPIFLNHTFTFTACPYKKAILSCSQNQRRLLLDEYHAIDNLRSVKVNLKLFLQKPAFDKIVHGFISFWLGWTDDELITIGDKHTTKFPELYLKKFVEILINERNRRCRQNYNDTVKFESTYGHFVELRRRFGSSMESEKQIDFLNDCVYIHKIFYSEQELLKIFNTKPHYGHRSLFLPFFANPIIVLRRYNEFILSTNTWLEKPINANRFNIFTYLDYRWIYHFQSVCSALINNTLVGEDNIRILENPNYRIQPIVELVRELSKLSNIDYSDESFVVNNLTGSACCGKSTLLNKLERDNWNLYSRGDLGSYAGKSKSAAHIAMLHASIEMGLRKRWSIGDRGHLDNPLWSIIMFLCKLDNNNDIVLESLNAISRMFNELSLEYFSLVQKTIVFIDTRSLANQARMLKRCCDGDAHRARISLYPIIQTLLYYMMAKFLNYPICCVPYKTDVCDYDESLDVFDVEHFKKKFIPDENETKRKSDDFIAPLLNVSKSMEKPTIESEYFETAFDSEKWKKRTNDISVYFQSSKKRYDRTTPEKKITYSKVLEPYEFSNDHYEFANLCGIYK